MDKLKLAGLIVLILIICLITFSVNYNKDDVQIDGNGGTRIQVEKENTTDVYNSGGSILEYDEYIYYVNTMRSAEKGFSNKVCRKKLNDNSVEEVLYDAGQYKIDDRLMIFNNNIFFSAVGQTYYINLENTSYIERYNQGVLYYINDGNLIFVYDNNIYKAEYYPKTMAIKSIKSIVKGNSTFIGEDEKNLYFYTNNSSNSKSNLAVNKENQTAYYIPESDIPKSAPNIYELKLNGNNVELYKNDELFVTVLKGIDEKISDTEVQKVGDYLYIKFYLINEDNEIEEMMFLQMKSDGTNIVRLNDTF